MNSPRQRFRILAVFAGGFLGPFAGIFAVSILPEIAATYGVATETASLVLVANVIPFATMMLFSGALSVRIGKARTVKLGYAAYIVAALFCFVAPTWESFLVGYALSGFSNAFTTPVLMSILKEVSAPSTLGRRLGIYASMQALGQLTAPFLSGLLAIVDWKLMFPVVALFAAALLITGLPHPPREHASTATGVRWWVVWRRGLHYLPLYFVLGLASLGIPYLVGIYVFDSWNATSLERGAVIMTGGIAILLFSNIVGALADRFNALAITPVGASIVTLGLVALPFTSSPVLTTLAWCTIVVGGQTCIISLNKQVLTKRGSEALISITQSLRFFGNAFSPLIILPFYLVSPFVGFWVCAVFTAVGFAVYWGAHRIHPGTTNDD